MNLTTLQRKLEHLAVLLEIRAGRDEKRREDELRLRLLAVLALVLAGEDYDAFRYSFLAELRKYYEALDVNGEYEQLINREIAVQNGYLSGFITDLRNGKLSDVAAKARAGSYAWSVGKVREEINLYGYDDAARLQWIMGENENHCQTCPSLHGKIKTAVQWRTLGLFPKCSLTDCDGACLCHFEEV